MSDNTRKVNPTINLLSEFSLPLILGVILALIFANISYESYEHLLHAPIIPETYKIFGKVVNFHFLINDVFMVFFFGIAAVEITQSILPGGALNPPAKAINPIMGTIGGVLGPALLYLLLTHIFHPPMPPGSKESVYHGWGIPTATDIAMAWLVARIVFGRKHPAVSFLLLLAVADDGIGLGIIAVFYPDPNHPVVLYWLGLTLLGMAVALGLRLAKVKSFWLYMLIGGGLSWSGLSLAHIHPALALIFIVPFMPSDKSLKPEGLFVEEKEEKAPLEHFEHTFKYFVDFGLLGFGLANAGVSFSKISMLTWIVLASLLVGKTVGITLFSWVAQKLGSPLPDGMDIRSLIIAGIVAGFGLTVALFVAGQAFVEPDIQGAAKMGAVFSASSGIFAWIFGKLFKIEKIKE